MLLPVTYIAEGNKNAFKILPEQSKSEEAGAIFKEDFKGACNPKRYVVLK